MCPGLSAGMETLWLMERTPFAPWMIAVWVDGRPVTRRAGDMAAKERYVVSYDMLESLN